MGDSPSKIDEDEDISKIAQFFGTNLKLQELIAWSVQDAFSLNPFKGWIDELDSALPVKGEIK